MLKLIVLLALPLSPLSMASAALPAQPRNPQIDYAGFLGLASNVRSYREARLLDFAAFKAAARGNALILDARSADAYRAGHIRGAVNLPFTDFTDASLAATIGDKDRVILIYCNNNFSNDVAPVPMKSVRLALNIQTFVNLVGYGYRNVYELNDVVDFTQPGVDWVTSEDG